MNEVDPIVLQVVMDFDQAKREFKELVQDARKTGEKAGDGLEKIDKGAQKSAKSVGKVSKAMKAAAAAVVGFAASVAVADKALSALQNGLARGDQFAKAARAIGVSADELIKLEFAASQTGVSAEALDTGLRGLVARIAAVERGSKEAVDVFQELGISAEDAVNQDLVTTLQQVADIMQGIESPTKRAAVAVQLFGESGVKLVNLLSEGSEGMEKLAQKADELGISLEGVPLERIEEANDAIDGMSRAFEALSIEVAAAFGPDIVSGINFVLDSTKKITQSARALRFEQLNARVKNLELLESFGALNKAQEASLKIQKAELTELAMQMTGLNDKIKEANQDRQKRIELAQQGRAEDEKAARINLANLEADLIMARKRGEADDEILVALYDQRKALEAIRAEREKLNDPKDPAVVDGTPQSINAEIEELELNQFERRREALRQFLAEREQLIDESDASAQDKANARIALEEYVAEMQKKLRKEQEKFRLQSINSELNMVSGLFSSLSSLMNTESRKLFEIGKVAAISEATIKGIQAAQNAYTWGSAWGPVAGGLAAAAAATASAVRVQQIANTSFGSGSGGGGVPTVASQPAPLDTLQPQQPAQQNITGNVTLVGDSFSADQVRGLFSELNDQLGDSVLLRAN